jgi:hypothetical protein
MAISNFMQACSLEPKAYYHMRFEVFEVVSWRIQVFWAVTPNNIASNPRRLESSCINTFTKSPPVAPVVSKVHLIHITPICLKYLLILSSHIRKILLIGLINYLYDVLNPLRSKLLLRIPTVLQINFPENL